MTELPAKINLFFDRAEQPPPPRAEECLQDICTSVQATSGVSEDIASLLALWGLSTWFADKVAIHPVLVLSGPAEVAARVLKGLAINCYQPHLLAGFQRRAILSSGNQTLLIAAFRLRESEAAVLGIAATPGFGQYHQKGTSSGGHSVAVYVGEVPLTKRIPSSLNIHLPACDSGFRPVPVQKEPWRTPDHIAGLWRYHSAHAEEVRAQKVWADDLLPDQQEIGSVLLNCLVDAPMLQQRLGGLLRNADREHRRACSANPDVVVVETVLALSRRKPVRLYALDIADECNRVLRCRGERVTLSAAKIGRALNRVGLITQRLSSQGNGITINKYTLEKMERLATMYGVEVPSPQSDNLPSLQGPQNELPVEPVEGMEVIGDLFVGVAAHASEAAGGSMADPPPSTGVPGAAEPECLMVVSAAQ